MDGDGSSIFKRKDGKQHGSTQARRADVSSPCEPTDAPGNSGDGRGRGSGQPRRVLLVTDMALFAEGLRVMFEAGHAFHVAGVCHDADAALAAVATIELDMLVLDADMPYTNPFDLAARIKQRRPGAGIVLLTDASLLAFSRQTAGANVDACMPKTAGFADLLSTLHRVSANKPDVDSGSSRARGDAPGTPQALSERRGEFTASEWKLMRVLTEGLPDSKTGAMLGMSAATVEAQRNALMGKLGLGTANPS